MENENVLKSVLFNSADAVIAGFAMWYDIEACEPRIKVVYLEKPEYTAVMEKVWDHFEDRSGNMPRDILYEMKFIVERNEGLLMEEWNEKKALK